MSGRYKAPLIEMSFFDKRYDYSLPAFNKPWAQFDNFLESSSKELLALSKALTSFLYQTIQREARAAHTFQGCAPGKSDLHKTAFSTQDGGHL